jgi:hypothetical protein
MTTAELIRQLQEADPTGELEVTVGKTAIHFLQVLPGYYDGCYQVLKTDPSNEYYNVVGAEIRGSGKHVCIETHSIREALWDEPDMPVTYDSDATREKYKHRVNEWRAEVRKATPSSQS